MKPTVSYLIHELQRALNDQNHQNDGGKPVANNVAHALFNLNDSLYK